MPSFLLTLWRLIRALRHALRDGEFRNLFVILLLVILSGVLFYSGVEGWSPIDALYFSVMTLSTVGAADMAPKTDAAKIFTVIYVLVGIGLFVAVARHIARQVIHGRRSDDDKA